MIPAQQKRALFICLLIVFALAVPLLGAPKAPFNRIVVFGASLSDTGNVYAWTGQQNTPPYSTLDPLLIPGAPYAKGGHHFSNGATWIEHFARPLGMAGDVRPALQGSDTKAFNYAVGGARAREIPGNPNTLSVQVGAFLADVGGVAPPDALYAIEIGGNDIRDALEAGGNPSIVLDALTAIGNNIETLYSAGARKFLIWNAPDLSLTPAIRILDGLVPGAAQGAQDLAVGFNLGLQAALASLGGLPEIQIVTLDVFGLLTEMTVAPADFDLVTVDSACVMPNTPPFECKQPDDYLFWDGIHPTTAAHAIVASRAAMAVQALY